MRLNNLKLRNFRAFKDVEIEIPQDLCIFTGVNGSGKSSILDAITIMLTGVINKIQKPNSSVERIAPSDVNTGSSQCSISSRVSYKEKQYLWDIVKDRGLSDGKKLSRLSGLNELVSAVREDYVIRGQERLPMVVLYPTSRATARSFPNFVDRGNVTTWEVYEHALKRNTGFQAFFEWFRVQDDILNERRLSQEEWMRRNWRYVSAEAIMLMESLEVIVAENRKLSIHEKVEDFKRAIGNDKFFWYNPRRFFYVMIDLFHEMESLIPSDKNLIQFFHEIEHITLRLSDDMEFKSPGSIIDEKIKALLSRLLESYMNASRRTSSKNLEKLLFGILRFSTMISFWWLSTKGKSDLTKVINLYEVRFTTVRNSERITSEFVRDIFEVIDIDRKRRNSITHYDGMELWVIRKAIEGFIPNYSNLRVSRLPRFRILVDKDGEELSFDQLSDGEKCLIAMIGDIARRLTLANPQLANPLEGNGIVLIDELELHLHPKWQRVLIERFTEVFPNCQLIATTHSPQIISNVPSENLLILKEGKVYQVNESYGQTSNRILEDVMDTDARPLPVKKELETLFRLIHNKDADKSRKLYKRMKELIGDDPELVKADVLIRRLERD